MLWDTAGQEEFDAITKAYYRGAQACVIAFSTTDHASFEAVKKWKRKVEDECGHVPMVLVQNKIDLLHESQVDRYYTTMIFFFEKDFLLPRSNKRSSMDGPLLFSPISRQRSIFPVD